MFGVNALKHLFSFLLSFVLLVTSLSVGLNAIAETIPQDNTLDRFATELTELIREFDSPFVKEDSEAESDEDSFDFVIQYNPSYKIEFASEFATGNSTTDLENVLKDYSLTLEDFESKRLIVKSYEEIDYRGAVDCVSGYKDLYILQYSTVEEVISAYQYYLTCDNIEYVEPDYVASVQAEEDDSAIFDGDSSEYYYEIIDKVESWNSEEIGFDAIKDELAQKQLSDVMVAVIDSGVDTDHELLEGRLIESTVNLSSSGEDNSCEDDYGHGTHVAGIVVDNSLSNVKVKPYKVLNNRGKGTISLISLAVDMAVADGADIINLSLTSEGESKTMTESVNAATEHDINVVVAAGNQRADLSKKYYTPANIESAITVSATTKDCKLASYSNYNGTIDIAAPGDDIKSSYLNNTYTLMDGTSMAAPQVTAGLAIIKSVFPELSSEEVENRIEEFSIKVAENEGENLFGAGILYLKYILSVMPRTAEPVFNVLDGDFSSTFKLTLSCPEADATILYVIYDGEDIQDIGFLNGTVYKEPISISVDTKISAVAYTKGKMFSSIVTHEYHRSDKAEEDKYDIDKNGLITGYFGKEVDLIVPDKIRGTTVKGIGASAFENNANVHSVILPESATVIKEHAFLGCMNLEKVSGEGITTVERYAFNLSTIADFPFEQLKTVGVYAFSGCNNLKNVNLSNAETIGKSAFENSRDVLFISSEKNVSIGENAFRGTNVKSVSLPNVTVINKSVFENCSELLSASIENATKINSRGFSDCISLIEINMPKAQELDAYAFKNTALLRVNFEAVESVGNYAFSGCGAIKYAFLPNASSIGAYAFNKCTSLEMVYFPALIELNNSVFSVCEKLKSLWLPSVEIINNWAFNNSYVEYAQFDNVSKIHSLPDTLLGIVLPTKFSSTTATIPQTDFVVYGYEGTYAEEYAKTNKKEFVTVPAVIYDVPESVSLEKQYIFTYALGFNCTYQWFKNDEVSNENGTIIEGATNFWYEPTRVDNTACYYCVITSTDGVNTNVYVTAPIKNIAEYQEADYTAYNAVIEEAYNIERELYTEESLRVLDELLEQDILGYSLAEQDLISQHIEAIKNAVSSLKFDYTLGDINDDGKISLMDARFVLKVVSGTEELDRLQTLSADMNEDGKISLIDVRAILRIISEAIEE